MSARVFAFIALMAASVSAFAPAMRTRVAAPKLQMSVFDDAVDSWKKQYPSIYAAGWGPTTKAERWNGVCRNIANQRFNMQQSHLSKVFIVINRSSYYRKTRHVWLGRASVHRLRKVPRINPQP